MTADPVKCEAFADALAVSEKLLECHKGVIRQAYQQGFQDCWAEIVALKEAMAAKKVASAAPVNSVS